MRHNLKILPIGLMTCKVKLINPKNSLSVTCNALIDTGAEITVMCESVFTELSFDENEVTQLGVSSLDKDDKVPAVNLSMCFPHDNWAEFRIGVYVKNFSKRDEYDVIIGMNVLVNYQLVYNGLNQVAWLEMV